MLQKPIFIYGPPGVGKSTLAKRLARHLDQPLIDLDHQIESQQGQTIPEIFAASGETVFRQMEKGVLAEAAAGGPAVVALGGGALLDPDSRALVEEKGIVVVLMASLEMLEARLGKDASGRPLLDDAPALHLRQLYHNRKPHYESFQIHVPADGVDPEALLWRVQAAMGRFHITGMGDGYDLFIGRKTLEHLPDFLEAKQLAPPFFLVMDHHLADYYQERLQQVFTSSNNDLMRFIFQAGESSKNLSTVQDCWKAMASGGMDRGGTCLALGGGVTGDLAGFAAAAFMRGIAWVNLPTSLLAMVDSSLGGKTGVDLPSGKNLVGAFHPPRMILTDLDFLATLPEREFRMGMAEVIKHGVIADPVLFSRCESGEKIHAHLDVLVPQAIAVKAQYVTQDPYEQGIRAALNFGHTVGHAVEIGMKFALTHGEAVAIGMVFEAWIAERIGLAQKGLSNRIAAVLRQFNLPTTIPTQLDSTRLIQALQYDKKKRQGQIYFALPEKPGKVRVGMKIDDLEALIKEGMQHE